MRYFCTYFDHNYLSKGLTLYRSLQRHCPSFMLWILCMNQRCYEILKTLNLPQVRLLALEEFEAGDAALVAAKQNRTMVEYYFTCTSSLLLYVLKHHCEIKLLTYLDADLYLFADPAPIYDEIADHSIAIIPHRFPARLRERERYGTYNVGWLSFARDENALACLWWWREKCLEWCYDHYEEGRFADQKYLDHWPTLFAGVVVLQHKGVNLAPWNIENYRIYSAQGRLWVDEYPLILFHFHGLSRIAPGIYDSCLAKYGVSATPVIRHSIYAPYLVSLLDVDRYIKPFLNTGKVANSHPKSRVAVGGRLASLLHTWDSLSKGAYLFVINDRVI